MAIFTDVFEDVTKQGTKFQRIFILKKDYSRLSTKASRK